MIRVAAGTEMTVELLSKLIEKHKTEVFNIYQPLSDAYENKYKVFYQPPKPEFKPDNRLAVNFARYMVDTMTGFFMGIPVVTTSTDEAAAEALKAWNAYNFTEDLNAELSKISDIYGLAYEMYYVDEVNQICAIAQTPEQAFIVYDDSVLERPVFFVRYYQDAEGNVVGSYSDEAYIYHFRLTGGAYRIDSDVYAHGFDGVPANEYRENTERMGLYSSLMPLFDEYNKAISEKANDVDYFADAYLKILGVKLDEQTLQAIRDKRIINYEGIGTNSQLEVEFLQKPNADTTQENLLDRLERLIFSVGMVANINDENFGTASGIAIRYRLWAMSALAKTKQNKFIAGFNRRYRLIFSHASAPENLRNAWTTIDYIFTLNYPANLLEETEIAKNLAGITSEATQLSVLSIVGDVDAELEKKADETAADTLGFEVG